mmetsp:Transcript_29752/g.88673  ORF Transcript_29752/g.88673 Transcript_29752/m.88673 type:complete len:244 (+) Transcript_29752:173-904(+)
MPNATMRYGDIRGERRERLRVLHNKVHDAVQTPIHAGRRRAPRPAPPPAAPTRLLLFTSSFSSSSLFRLLRRVRSRTSSSGPSTSRSSSTTVSSSASRRTRKLLLAVERSGAPAEACAPPRDASSFSSRDSQCCITSTRLSSVTVQSCLAGSSRAHRCSSPMRTSTKILCSRWWRTLARSSACVASWCLRSALSTSWREPGPAPPAYFISSTAALVVASSAASRLIFARASSVCCIRLACVAS